MSENGTKDPQSPPAGDVNKVSEEKVYDPIRGGIRNAIAAYKHIRAAAGTETIQQRREDHITVGLVLVCVLFLLVAIVLGFPAYLQVLPLALTNIVLLVFILNRIGIFLGVTHRQALIFWQLILGALWLGVTSGMLVMSISLFWMD